MRKMTWKDKHKMLLKNKKDIIKQYNDFVPVKLIAREYGVTISCISINLKKWGIRKKHGIKYLLNKAFLKGND